MPSINALHAKFCPTKSMCNFWRSIDYNSAAKVVEALGETPRSPSSAGTVIHPLVALAFLRWADPDKFYRKLKELI